MKIVAVLKNPNIDIICDVGDYGLSDFVFGEINSITCENVFVVQWIDKYVKMIPFKAAKNLVIDIPTNNIAMMFESDEKLKLIHNEELKKDIAQFQSEKEYLDLIQANKAKVAETLKK